MPRKPFSPMYRRKGGRAITPRHDADTNRHHEIDLGEWDSPECREACHRLIAEWLAAGYRTPQRESAGASGRSQGKPLTVAELASGKMTNERCSLKSFTEWEVDTDGSRMAEPHLLRAAGRRFGLTAFPGPGLSGGCEVNDVPPRAGPGSHSLA
ncbi:MAG: hypothetical protein KA354_05850 [Phycisphaerae bacterium]|nr:hypothetical protein [Phycisphaerae bacterium]